MKKILPLLFLILAFSGNDASAATVTTVKDICRCIPGEVTKGNDNPFFTKAYAVIRDCASWSCDNACVATFATNKNQYVPNENVTISVDYSGSNPPVNWGCASEANGSGQLTNTIAFVSPSSPYTHAAPAGVANYTQSVSALYTCGNHPVGSFDCEYYPLGSGTQYWTFPSFSEAFLPFSVIAPVECNDSADNDADTLIDSADPGCHSDGDASNASSYVPTDTSEANGLTLQLHGRFSFLFNQLHDMFSAINHSELARK